MKTALLTALLRLGIEKGIQRKTCPGLFPLRIAAVLCTGIGSLFLLIALHRQLRNSFGDVTANTVFGALFFILAAGVFLIISLRRYRYEQQPQQTPLAELQQAAQPLLNNARQIGQKVQQKVGENRGKILLSVLIAGVLLGRRQAKQRQSSQSQ